MDIRQISESEFGTHDSSAVAAELRRVSEACDEHDGVITLNEQACLQLKYRGLRDASLWVARVAAPVADPADVSSTVPSEGAVVGFAFLHNGNLDLAVHPEHRGQGIGTSLAQAALRTVDRIEAWSHADHPAAARIAQRFGVPRERELLIMSRPTSQPLPSAPIPHDIVIRTFRPADRDALLEVNAHAFANHPEQGHMSAEDFEERTRESWYDDEGLFVAIREDDLDGDLVGFHWTKVHRDEDPPYGEVYVVAVSPKAAGKGLGKVLTNIGLAHLADTGVAEVILYVDGNNEPAIAVYENQGFTRSRTEAQYRGTPVL